MSTHQQTISLQSISLLSNCLQSFSQESNCLCQIVYSQLVKSQIVYCQIFYSQTVYSQLVKSQIVYSQIVYRQIVYIQIVYNQIVYFQIGYCQIVYSQLVFSIHYLKENMYRYTFDRDLIEDSLRFYEGELERKRKEVEKAQLQDGIEPATSLYHEVCFPQLICGCCALPLFYSCCPKLSTPGELEAAINLYLENRAI